VNYVPCRFCADRSLHCHSRCEKYIKYKAEREKERAERLSKLDVDSHVVNGIRDREKKRRK
jgi:hypothetical protein